tara:strand:+ start:123 stop:545 length:423 start_codon:yes stop_codon:yes gene_type:complete
MSDNILNPKLYEKAKKEADKVYKRNSAYKSMFISKKYKELGGKYKTTKKKAGSTDNWTKEEWIQVIPYLTKGDKIACGLDNKKNKVCRPLKRINSNTPITINELLKLHKKEDLIKLANKKLKDMDGRIFWKTLKFIPSKK